MAYRHPCVRGYVAGSSCVAGISSQVPRAALQAACVVGRSCTGCTCASPNVCDTDGICKRPCTYQRMCSPTTCICNGSCTGASATSPGVCRVGLLAGSC